MSKETTRLALPYPEDSDVPNGPAQIKALAEKLDLVVPKFYTPKIIATEQSRENVAFGLLGTADEIPSVVVPTNGFMMIGYQALAKSSVGNAGKAAIFLGANQLKIAGSVVGEAPVVSEESIGTGTGFGTLTSDRLGLRHHEGGAAFVTTGQVMATNTGTGGGVVFVHAAAGTYNVSVQWRATSGTVTAKERKLWVVVFGAS